MKRRKGFTLVELLVVIAIIALLMGILMPALARVRAVAYRLVCGTNLSGIGKSMILYANDYEEEYPVAGPRSVKWGNDNEVAVWDSKFDADEAYGTGNDIGTTVTSCFYLLVKWYDTSSKQFVCKGDDARAFEFTTDGLETDPATDDFEIEDAWDFGGYTQDTTAPGDYCSYSYHYPFVQNGFSLSISSSPSSPLVADRNPWLDQNAYAHLNDTEIKNALWKTNKYQDTDKRENSASHNFDGQNVLYNDIHVSFEKKPIVGVQLDNIWKRWQTNPAADDQERQLNGTVPSTVGSGSSATGNKDMRDAYMINEIQNGMTDFTSE